MTIMMLQTNLVTNQNFLINESTLVLFNTFDPYKVYIRNLAIEFDGFMGSDFLEHYSCAIDFNKKQLISYFKTISWKLQIPP